MSLRLIARINSAGAIFFAAAPIAANLGARAFPVIQAIAAIWGAPWHKLPPLGRANVSWLAPLLLALGWALASAFWSLTPDAPMRAAKLALVIGCILLFGAGAGHTPEARRVTRLALIASVTVLAGLSLIEAGFDLPLNRWAQPDAIDMIALQRNPGRGVCILTLLIYPALVAIWRAPALDLRLPAFGLLAAAGWLSLQFDVDANALALSAGGLAFLIALALPRLGLALCGIVWAGWLMAAPWISERIAAWGQSFPLSWRMRGEIWGFAADRIAERPIFGWGFESARSFTGQQSLDGVTFANVPLHTHSGSMQIWLEFGLIGAGLTALAMLLGARSAVRTLGGDRLAAAGAVGAAGAAMIHFNVSYGAWQEWWLVTLGSAAVAAACLQGTKPDPREQLPAIMPSFG